MSPRKHTIFLGDLTHTWEKVGFWTFPLNIGFMASYAQKIFPGEFNVRLFKRPDQLIEAIKLESPDIVALSHYVWNTKLNHHVFSIVKACNPNTLTIGGGPIFTNLNADLKTAQMFFSQYNNCNVFVLNQGEPGFIKVLAAHLESGGDLKKFRDHPLQGCLTNIDGSGDFIKVAEALPPLADLNDIPSPYLNGMMDPFFQDTLTPLIETNRGCPYRCTFCAWGIGTKKLNKFNQQRVAEEIKYIAQRCTKSVDLLIADANFGILSRDPEIASEILKAFEKYGYPGHVSVQWNKSNPDRVIKAAKNLKGLSEITSSLQSINKDTLRVIKRKNLSLETIADEIEALQEKGRTMNVFSELILGLPEETKESHIEGNRILLDLGVELKNYNLHLLPGTEMDTKECREKYFRRTGWRLHDGAYGVYDGVRVIEGQEVVLETSTFPMKELRAFRFIHFLMQMMWGKRHFFDYLNFLKIYRIHPMDAILTVDDACRNNDGEMGEVFQNFRKEHDLENFHSFDDLYNYWCKDDNFEMLRAGKSGGKLNFQFSVVILRDHREDFDRILGEVGTKLLNQGKAPIIAHDQLKEVLRFGKELSVEVNDDFSLLDSKLTQYQYDFLSWRKTGYQQPLTKGAESSVKYEFYLENKQRRNLERQLVQYRSDNIRMTLRTMAVYIRPEDLLYSVKHVS